MGRSLRKWISPLKIAKISMGETKPGEYEGVCLNPKDASPDNWDDVMLGRMERKQYHKG